MNIQERTEDLVRWIKDWFEANGKDCNAVVGMSGGKDSLIVAALCVRALGKDRVIGVLMPNGYQKDIKDAEEACAHLEIETHRVNIGLAICALLEEVGKSVSFFPSEQTATNLPARIRMATLYAISQTCNGRVANTCNRSENYVGYETKYGDGAGDFSPLGNLTVREVLEIGDCLGLPHHLVHKVPIDGLKTNEDGSYVTDEQSLGFTYEELDNYLLNGIVPPEEKLERIEQLHARGVAKRQMGVYTKPGLEDERSSDMVRACLSLIRSHAEGKDDQFEETALAIAKDLGGSRESFVQGLFGKADMLVPQEPVLWTVNVHYADNEVDRVSFQRVDNGWPTKEEALDEFVKSWSQLKEIKLDNEPKEENK